MAHRIIYLILSTLYFIACIGIDKVWILGGVALSYLLLAVLPKPGKPDQNG